MGRGFSRAEVAGQVSAQLGGHVSSSTLSAHQMALAESSDESLLQESEEEEEDPDLWVDEAGRRWMRTAARPGRWYLLGTGMNVGTFWDEARQAVGGSGGGGWRGAGDTKKF